MNKKINDKMINFNDFLISLDDEWITIKSSKGNFFGQYHLSNNRKYLIAYCDAHGEVDKKGHESTISGQVYLIQNQNTILWRKDINRPNGAFVSDDGTSVVIDWLAFKKELSGKVYFFKSDGKKLSEYKFNSNIGGQEISKDDSEVIITTCFPENAIYLFSIKDGKLIKKIENKTSKKPLINFDFEKIKEYMIKSDKFNQEEYDTKKLREEQKIQEDKEKIELLKKKKINNMNYEEIVEMGSIYVGDFYGNFGEPKKALEYLLRAIELRKEKPQPYILKLIGFCCEKLENYKEAIKFYELALKQYPQYKNSVIIDHLEFCKLKLNKNLEEDWDTFIVKKREKAI